MKVIIIHRNIQKREDYLTVEVVFKKTEVTMDQPAREKVKFIVEKTSEADFLRGKSFL